jgi:formylglycine-generating enzyme required for sulfatase activity
MKIKPILSLLLLAALASSASASISIDYVSVGHAGNAADSTGYGAVAYAYQIGKYEVTNAQYGAFLNAKGASNSGAIYNAGMASYGITQTGSSGSFSYSVTTALANRPVVHVSWFDAARFANWMMNGQGGNDMETGAYTLNGATSGIITANIGAQVYLPSENEWYKAAFYNAANASYSLYPNGQSGIVTGDANYDTSGSSDVGSYREDASSYGTFDQGGNVWEWNDAVISGSTRGLRGGSWGDDGGFLDSLTRYGDVPTFENYFVGFRVARVASVPEPTSIVLTMLAGGMMLIRRKR